MTAPMILEVNPGDLRDIAAAIHAARKREPSMQILAELEALVLRGITARRGQLELGAQQAQALRNALLQRAWDQRSTSEGFDYSDLAERIGRALDDEPPPLEEFVGEPNARRPPKS